MSNTRATAVKSGAKLPKDHAVKAEVAGAPMKVVLQADKYNGEVDLELTLPRDIVDSYEALNAVYGGFTMPVMQQLPDKTREIVLDAATDETGKIRATVVQRILITALTEAAQGE